MGAIWAASLISLLAAIGLATSTWQISAARNEAVEARSTAESQATRAQANLDLAIESLDRIYTEVIGEQLANAPKMTRMREQMLRESLEFYQRFATQNEQDEATWPQTGRAYLLQGRIRVELDQLVEAEEAYAESWKIFSALIRRHPEQLEHRWQAAEVASEKGSLDTQWGDLDLALASFGAAFYLLQPGGDPATEQSRARQLEAPGHAALLANLYHEMGVTYSMGGEDSEANESFERAARLWQALVDQDDSNPDYHHRWGETLRWQALADIAAGRTSQALARQQQAFAMRPESAKDRRALRELHHQCGNLLIGDEAYDEAIAEHRAGNLHARELAADFPELRDDLWGAAFSHYSLAHALMLGGQRAKAQQNYRICLNRWQEMSCKLAGPRQSVHLYQTVATHPDAFVLADQRDPLRALGDVFARYRRAAPQSAELTKEEDERLKYLEKIPARPNRVVVNDPINARDETEADAFFMGFCRVIDALSENNLMKAMQHLERARQARNSAIEEMEAAFPSVPNMGFTVELSELVIAHAGALCELAQTFGMDTEPNPEPAAREGE